MSLLSFDCVHRFDSGFVLDARFEIGEGVTVTSLFGPSGAGKTSVLSMIAGTLRPERGVISLADRVLFESATGSELKPEERGVGVVFQDHLLFPHLDVRANLLFGEVHRKRRSRGSGPPVELEPVAEVLELSDLLGRKPASLSGGQQQRVALGRALLSRPELLLMDEPLAALDETLKRRILAYLERVATEWKIPTLFVSHGQAEVRRLADSVVLLDDGRVVDQGPPDQALGRPEPLAWKGGFGPVNLLRVDQIAREGESLHGRVGTQVLSLPPLGAGPPSGSMAPLQGARFELGDRGAPADAAYVQFSPGEVALAVTDLEGLSVRNRLRGTVRRVVDLEDRVFVAVDVGQIIWSEVTPEALAELGLESGREVTCLIKTHSLRVV